MIVDRPVCKRTAYYPDVTDFLREHAESVAHITAKCTRGGIPLGEIKAMVRAQAARQEHLGVLLLPPDDLEITTSLRTVLMLQECRRTLQITWSDRTRSGDRTAAHC